jgi:hypothetical protein
VKSFKDMSICLSASVASVGGAILYLSVARRLEPDEDKVRFEKMLGKIAKAKPTQRER